ncbi:hypothetical protein ACGFIG_14865 [Micromonospora sp. NPDC049048]|uniref:hypothetical protein n=1 Tax=Micromonospora sp. NPDC049048 TaxID=3364263 RepID=UPI003711BE20
MVSQTDVRDTTAAMAAAHRLTAALHDLNDAAVSAAALVARTEQMSPLWGDDAGGREYRQNYAKAGEQIRPAIETLTSGLVTLSSSVKSALIAIVEADDLRRPGS